VFEVAYVFQELAPVQELTLKTIFKVICAVRPAVASPRMTNRVLSWMIFLVLVEGRHSPLRVFTDSHESKGRCSVREFRLEGGVPGGACSILFERDLEQALTVVRSPSCRRLTTLDLSGGRGLTVGIAAIIAQSIGPQRSCPVLSELLLHNRSLGVEGAKAVGYLIEKLPSSGLSITLQDNNINNAGAEILAEALLKATYSLGGIYLDSNPIGREGALALTRFLDSEHKPPLLSYFGLTGTTASFESGGLDSRIIQNRRDQWSIKNHDGGTLTPSEVSFYSSEYQRHFDAHDRSGCERGNGKGLSCAWPSCYLIWASRLALSSSVADCVLVRKSMGSFSEAIPVGLEKYLYFLEQNPGAILARATRRQDASSLIPKSFGEPSMFFPRWQREIVAHPSEFCQLRSSQPEVKLFYVRIPKTASTATMKVLEENACLQNRVDIVDHGDGCLHRWRCNASCPLPPLYNPSNQISFQTPSVAVIRSVCDRFVSAVAHLQGDVNFLRSSPGLARFVSWDSAVESVLALLRPNAAGIDCRNATTPHCLVNVIDSKTAILGSHRVILYPQSFFVHDDSKVFCFRSRHQDVTEPLVKFISATLGCPVREEHRSNSTIFANTRKHPLALSPSHCREVQTLYSSDAALWNQHC
jgi:hypothetical protein